MSGRSKMKDFWAAVRNELHENKRTFVVYTGLRLLVIIMMLLQIFNHNYEQVFLCALTLVLMIMPSVVQVTFKMEFPSTLEIIILFFIFAAEILGEIASFYIHFLYWDTILHTLSGFLCAALGLSLVEILNRDERLKFKLSPLFMAIVAFCFSMTIGVLWEFFEFGMDSFFNLDMQKDTVITSISSTYIDPTHSNKRIPISGIEEVLINGDDLGVDGYLDIGLIDTMEDLLVNFIGAFTFAVLGFIYARHKDKRLMDNLVPTAMKADKYKKIEEEKEETTGKLSGMEQAME